MGITNPLRPEQWDEIPGFKFTDVACHHTRDVVVVKIAFNRPEVRNAFRPHTADELITALEYTRISADTDYVPLTGSGPSPKDGGWALCFGGDQCIRGRAGYRHADGETVNTADRVKLARLHTLEA